MDSLFGIKTLNDDFEVEYEILSTVDRNQAFDSQRKEIMMALQTVDGQLEACEQEIAKINAEIDRLTNHADGLDYTIAVASGVIAGIVDSLFVGELSIENANNWGQEKVDKFVVSVAKSQGYAGDDVDGAILYLAENKKHSGGETKGYHLASDSVTNLFGGGTQHHLRDFAHHPTPVGLTFSMLTQFTEKAYGTDTAGRFLVVDVKNKEFIGKDLPHKILYGIIFWGFHMVSDMAGSGGTISGGTGVPGPIVSLLKEISVLPLFRDMKINDEEFSKWISKLFNGTLLGKRDENGKLIPLKFDLKTEIGLLHELGKQAVPVILNECIVRGFYFIRRLYLEIKEKEIKNLEGLKYIDWKKTLPANNRTIARMLTISTGTFTAIDMADAAVRAGVDAIKSGGNAAVFLKGFVLKVNFVGVGRFAIAIGTDVKMGVQRNKLRDERMSVMGKKLTLLNTKVYYKCAGIHCVEKDMFESQAIMWLEAGEAVQTLMEASEVAEESVQFCQQSLNEIYTNLKNISQYVDSVEQYNPGLTQDLANILKWGEK